MREKSREKQTWHEKSSRGDYDIRITKKPDKNKKDTTIIIGRALDEFGKVIPCTKRTTAFQNDSKGMLEHSVQLVKKRVERAMTDRDSREKKRRKKNCDLIDNHDSIFFTAFHVLKQGTDAINPKWSQGTRAAALTYFENHILPFLLECGDETPVETDIEGLRNHLLAQINLNGKSSKINRTMQQTLLAHLRDADYIYCGMRKNEPSIPLIQFAPQREKRIQQETIKSLSNEVRLKFAKKLEESISHAPEMVFGAVLMFDGGLRTGEASAVRYGVDTKVIDSNLVVVRVCFQEKDGRKSSVLKTRNSYRLVMMSYWGSEMLRKCMNAMPPQELPGNAAPIRKRDLSKWIREVLTECGVDEQMWKSIEAEEQRQPDYDREGKPLFDVCAYILRRDRCSRWRNICGLQPIEIDELLGHKVKIPQAKRKDMKTDEALISLAEKLERYVYDPSISQHPYFRPIELQGGTHQDIIPYPAVKIRNSDSTALKVTLNIGACIPGEEVRLIISGDRKAKVISSSGEAMNTRDSAPVIGAKQKGVFDELS